LACIPSRPIDKAVETVKQVVKRGGVRGLDVANTFDMPPTYDPYWEPLWEVINDCGLPMHFHTVGTRIPDAIRKTLWSGGADQSEAPMDYRVARAGFAVHITSFQMFMSMVLMGMIYGGVLERHPRITLVLGEGGVGWIPYILDRMDLEWEDQFLGLSMAPREYWRRWCASHLQSDKVG
jgi:predicted TIM-barrel fold metal-dependent hydrolase